MPSVLQRGFFSILSVLAPVFCLAQAEQWPGYDSLATPPGSHAPRHVDQLPDKDWAGQSISLGAGELACVQEPCKDIKSAPFGTGTHSALVQAARQCSDPLVRAVYWQDYFHQFESKAHFDNCAFDDSVNYIEELQNAVDAHVKTADPIDLDKVMFTLGQALHAIQDFYAHTDYVERMEQRFARFRDVPVLPVWTLQGRAELQRLRDQGLSSGAVWWGWPKYCPAESATHGAMSKDHGDSGRGAEPTRWQHWSRFEAAQRLAKEASELFLRNAFERWPALGQSCGSGMVYAVPRDARKEPPAK